VLGYVPDRLVNVITAFDRLEVKLTAMEQRASESTRKYRLTLGYYPGAKGRGGTRTEMRELLEHGYQCFVDLTLEGEHLPYSGILSEEAENRGVKVVYKRFPIPNGSVPLDPLIVAGALSVIEDACATDRKVYLHGGRDDIGPCTFVAACWLLDHGWSADQAIGESVRVSGSSENSCSQEQLSWIRDWSKLQRQIRKRRKMGVVYNSTWRQFRSLDREANKFRTEARRGATIEPSALDDLAERVSTFKETVYSTFDAWLYFWRITPIVPRKTSYISLSTEAFFSNAITDLIDDLGTLEAKLAAISAPSKERESNCPSKETTTFESRSQTKLRDLAIRIERSAVKRITGIGRRSG
jgi:hypothetical protein